MEPLNPSKFKDSNKHAMPKTSVRPGRGRAHVKKIRNKTNKNLHFLPPFSYKMPTFAPAKMKLRELKTQNFRLSD